MRTCNYGPCEHEDEYNALGAKYEKLKETLLDLAARYDALSVENLELRVKLRGDAVDDRAGLVERLVKERRWREDAEAKYYELRRTLSELSTGERR